jgi:hypothetical protein
MSRALAIHKALLLSWRVSSALIFLAAALAFGSLLCMAVTDGAGRGELPAARSSVWSR